MIFLNELKKISNGVNNLDLFNTMERIISIKIIPAKKKIKYVKGKRNKIIGIDRNSKIANANRTPLIRGTRIEPLLEKIGIDPSK